MRGRIERNAEQENTKCTAVFSRGVGCNRVDESIGSRAHFHHVAPLRIEI